MLFSTIAYFVFFFVVLALFYLGPRPIRKVLLLVASYFFYMSWNWKFIPLLLTLTVIDYIAALYVERAHGATKRLALIVSLTANLGFLGFFKYYNFFTSNVAVLFGQPADAYHLAIVLPLGISFHTFQSMSYVVDVFRGQQAAIRRPLDYALYISFFPQLVAGPIVRARDFFRDLYGWQTPSLADVRRGAFLVVLGLVKKVALADNFAIISDNYFGAVNQHPGGAAAWGGTFAFALQIYFDFSGYTDMAIGCARLLGFHFPTNFRRPYLAISITDFWRRWHMSLSSWLRDYLYIPLGGNRGSRWMTYRNLMLTMLLGGLWHGASWNFVIWGGLHGFYLSIERLIGAGQVNSRGWSLRDAPRTLLVFVLVCVGWVFFRATTLADALAVLGAMFNVPHGDWPVQGPLMILGALAFIVAVCEERFGLLQRVDRAPMWVLAACCGCLLFVAEIFALDALIPFVYFQF